MNYKINAYKPTSEGDNRYMTSCDIDDKEASVFRINYFVQRCGFNSDVEVDNKMLAQKIVRAMNSSYDDGRNDAFKDIRNLIGVK